MKTKTQETKPVNEKQIRNSKSKTTSKTQKIPTRMGYHGKDEEKNLNPEE